MDLLQSFSSQQPESWDFYLVILAAVSFPLLRFLLDTCLFKRVAIWCLHLDGIGSEKALKDASAVKLSKFKESLWKFSCYTGWEIFIYKISMMEPWFYNHEMYFSGWPHQPLKLPLKLYYTSQCGFYVYGLVALIVWETRRKDFGVMFAHHIITILLISFSYSARFLRVGAMTLALHDVSDLIMELAKLCKYSGKELTASVCFGVFAISWFTLRLVYFPFWVIRSTSYELVKVLDHSSSYHTWIFYSFNTMLITLLIFHIYWWMLICRMAFRQLQNKGKIGEDIRSGIMTLAACFLNFELLRKAANFRINEAGSVKLLTRAEKASTVHPLRIYPPCQ
ncbi:hypothetical protein GOP47_0000699 [Adiantum capillus-veneris]|uniref:TLC domain-containing protein n=1 Tax=Adiantum capillus-veneris TaxID=13818 RepID=A0A9D4VEF5_ADICA|nr:hypothetical protein GOP47_0000699 [Adiantum capillus-veneris]